MKTVKYFSMMLMLAIAAFSFTACGSDDETTDDNYGLIGSWYVEDYLDPGVYLILTFTNTKLTETALGKIDNTWYKSEGDSSNITIDGNQIKAYVGESLTYFTYSISGNTLTLTTQNGEKVELMRMTAELQKILDSAKVYQESM